MQLGKLILTGALMVSASTVNAGLLTVDSYDMFNGDVGTYSYWDESYDGAGNVGVSRSLLTGGTGDLTDGIVAPGPWTAVEPGSGVGGAVLGDNGPYVGWVNFDPLISFNFAQTVNITQATIFVDNSVNVGGVGGPANVLLDGALFGNPVARVNGTTAALTFDLNFTGDSLDVQLLRSSPWVFVSEVEFQGTVVAVPLPATVFLFGLGMAGLAWSRRKQG